ncbi:hypothetical protein, partial [Enterobacter intestinihominis]
EPAKEAVDVYYANRGKKPVVGGGVTDTHHENQWRLCPGVASTFPQSPIKNKIKRPPKNTL